MLSECWLIANEHWSLSIQSYSITKSVADLERIYIMEYIITSLSLEGMVVAVSLKWWLTALSWLLLFKLLVL